MITIGKHVVSWVAKQTNEFGNFGTETGIGWIGKEGQLIGGVAYADWNGPNVVCHIASDKSRHWLTRQFLWTIFDYPFKQLNCKRITVCVGQGNTNSIRFVQHLGFIREATLTDAHPTGDLLIFALRRDNCRWLGLRWRDEKMAA